MSERSIPRYAVLGALGTVRIMRYAGHGYFYVLDRSDNVRYVHRDRLTFLPER